MHWQSVLVNVAQLAAPIFALHSGHLWKNGKLTIWAHVPLVFPSPTVGGGSDCYLRHLVDSQHCPRD